MMRLCVSFMNAYYELGKFLNSTHVNEMGKKYDMRWERGVL